MIKSALETLRERSLVIIMTGVFFLLGGFFSIYNFVFNISLGFLDERNAIFFFLVYLALIILSILSALILISDNAVIKKILVASLILQIPIITIFGITYYHSVLFDLYAYIYLDGGYGFNFYFGGRFELGLEQTVDSAKIGINLIPVLLLILLKKRTDFFDNL